MRNLRLLDFATFFAILDLREIKAASTKGIEIFVINLLMLVFNMAFRVHNSMRFSNMFRHLLKGKVPVGFFLKLFRRFITQYTQVNFGPRDANTCPPLHSKALHQVGTVCSAILDQRREILSSDRRQTRVFPEAIQTLYYAMHASELWAT